MNAIDLKKLYETYKSTNIIILPNFYRSVELINEFLKCPVQIFTNFKTLSC